MQYVAIVKLLEKFKWNWVGIITSDDESGQRELQQLSKLFREHGICIELEISVSLTNYNHIPPDFQSSSTQVIIICGSYNRAFLEFVYIAADIFYNKTVILPASWAMVTELTMSPYNTYPVNCSFVFKYPDMFVVGLQEYYDSIHTSSRSTDPLLEDIWIERLKCFSDNKLKNHLVSSVTHSKLSNCSLERSMKGLLYYDTDRTPYQVYIAVLSMAFAVQNLLHLTESGKYLKINKVNFKCNL